MVHKYQGCSVKVIIGALDNVAYIMLTKELLYTLLTRAEKHCVLVGENSAVSKAVRDSAISGKRTYLKQWLMNK